MLTLVGAEDYLSQGVWGSYRHNRRHLRTQPASPLPPRPLPQIICLAASVILAYFVCSDGTTNWLMGLQLIATYCLIAFIYALKKEPLPPGPVPSPSPVPSPLPPSLHNW